MSAYVAALGSSHLQNLAKFLVLYWCRFGSLYYFYDNVQAVNVCSVVPFSTRNKGTISIIVFLIESSENLLSLIIV